MIVKVLEPLRHSGELYRPGEFIAMEPKQAERLIEDGIAEKADEKPAEDKSPEAPVGGDQKPADVADKTSTGADENNNDLAEKVNEKPAKPGKPQKQLPVLSKRPLLALTTRLTEPLANSRCTAP
jgi:hypothetical protein